MCKYYFLPIENGRVAPGVCSSGALPATAVECTYEQYTKSAYYTVNNGVITASQPPALPLKTQAQTMLRTQQTYVMQTYTLYGDDTPPDWLSYLKTLRAIANGTDTTSTILPTPPALSA